MDTMDKLTPKVTPKQLSDGELTQEVLMAYVKAMEPYMFEWNWMGIGGVVFALNKEAAIQRIIDEMCDEENTEEQLRADMENESFTIWPLAENWHSITGSYAR